MSKITRIFLVLLAAVIFIALVIFVIAAGILLISSLAIYTGYATRWLFKEESIGIYEASLLNLISLTSFIFIASFFGLWTKLSRMAGQLNEFLSVDDDEEYEDEDYDEYDDDSFEDEDYDDEDEEDEEDERERKIIKRDWAEKKVGRNEKCPCGSGRKFKNCCGRYL